MNDKLGWKILGVGLMLLVLALAFMVCVGKEWNQVWAAWIQAIGSILAICYAFYIADGESRKRQARDNQELADSAARHAAIAKYVLYLVDTAVSEEGQFVRFSNDSLIISVRNARELVSLINIETVSGLDNIRAWLEIRQVIFELEQVLAQPINSSKSVLEELLRRAAAAKQTLS
ncbi:hypothetical protein ACNFH5_09690 [Pseudomonas sp. NY15435]|uniref:hypothetical protein n=1 Tax=Pseudomonas sp. NY15435 TaxID=3400358 RepID=UPI003A877707